MRTLRSAVLLAAATLALAACATQQSGLRPAARGSSRGGGPITHADVVASGAANAYELVQTLRPVWLRRRGATSVNDLYEGIVVYLDNGRLGGIESLREIAAASVGTVRFFDPAAANYRFGQGHVSGAIQVVTATPDGMARSR